MKIEHVAINVKNPPEMAAWYVKHLGLKVVSKKEMAPFTHFLADDSGRVMIEFYNNPPDQVPDYANMDPLLLHFAFVSEDTQSDKDRLIEAGASFYAEVNPDKNSSLLMLRDPWGLAIQLCKRSKPLLEEKEL
ncbi:MAG: VOC family protein [Bacteroidota bacterium]